MPDSPTIELVYDRNCPNADGARAMIRAALRAVGADPAWTEWDREASDTPPDRRGFGSPTVLVDGRDVAGDDRDAGAANACRVYVHADGTLRGIPSSRLIVRAIEAASARRRSS